MQGNCKPSIEANLGCSEKGAYKPAYKKSQKTTADQLRDMPVELAEIVAVWHDLPVHIKAAITTLAQTTIQGGAR
jgi:hypothetical protein